MPPTIRWSIRIYGFQLSVLFAVVFTAQILGMLGLYQRALVLGMTTLVAILACVAYLRFNRDFFSELIPDDTAPRSSVLDITLYGATIVLLGAIFVWRMVRWLGSSLGNTIPNDFIAYHGIKALDLYHTGSLWNLAIPYGQFATGYENLLSFAFFFNYDFTVTGIIHALVFLLLWQTVVLLLVRWSKMPLSHAFFAALLVCLLPIVFPRLLNVGKNDMLLSLTVLIALLHAPIGSRVWHPLGLAYATMISLATKATGLYILFYLWGLVMLFWGLAFRTDKGISRERGFAYFHPAMFMSVIAVMFPGGFWVIRNFLAMGQVFTSEVNSFFGSSIAANLTNPTLYNSGAGSQSLAIVLMATIVAMLVVPFIPRLRVSVSGLLLVAAFSFIVAPLGAFLFNLNYLTVQWRYVLHGLILLYIIGIVVGWQLLHEAYSDLLKQRVVPSLLVMITLLVSGYLVTLVDYSIPASPDEQRAFYMDPTNSDDSIYDQLADLPTGVVYLERVSWLPVAYTNPNLTVTELRYPLGNADAFPQPDLDYIAYGGTNEPQHPIFTQYRWEIIFQNNTGTLYQRTP